MISEANMHFVNCFFTCLDAHLGFDLYKVYFIAQSISFLAQNEMKHDGLQLTLCCDQAISA